MDKYLLIIFVICAVGVSLLSFAIHRFWASWFGARAANKLLRDIKAVKSQNQQGYSLEIAFDSTGFSVKSLKQPVEKQDPINWSEIERVTAFKRDLLTTDCICLFFALSDETGVELNEEMKHWPELLEAMSNYLPGCKSLSEWIFDVGSPAFATNLTEIYSRTA